jgi:hypothetical protein
MSVDVDKLAREAERHEAEARKRREKLEGEAARQAAEQERRGRAFDERLVAEYDPERLEQELREAYDALVEAVAELPIVPALVRHHAASARRMAQAQEVNNALTRLGRDSRVFEPSARELDVMRILDQIVSRMAAAIVEEERAASYAERGDG